MKGKSKETYPSRVIDTHIVKTEYGLCMMVETSEGKWYKLTHHSLSYDGGGTMSWDTITDKEAYALLHQYTKTVA